MGAYIDAASAAVVDMGGKVATALPPHVTMSHTPLHRHSSVGK